MNTERHYFFLHTLFKGFAVSFFTCSTNQETGHALEFVVPRQGLAEVGGLGADKEVVLVQDLGLGEVAVVVGVRLVDEVLGLGLAVVEVGGDDPGLDLKMVENVEYS